MKIIILLVIVALLSTGMIFSQTVMPPPGQNTSLPQNVFGLGFFGGASGGFGISFRHHLPAPLSYQITGGIIKFSERLYSDIGIEVQYDLTRGGGTRFFACGGFGYYYSGKNGNNDISSPTRGGIGLGGEWLMSGGLHFLAEGMFTFFSDGTILPLPQAGVYFYFN